ncbi:MAG: hypothetical protein LBF26_00200 [Puniceicoccales bacterium]|nr:hypothetical protein [Puniceicoccales bacterium]
MRSRVLWLCAAAILSLCGGCCSDRCPDEASLPWARPSSWEGSNPLSAITQR